jgi:hypothetical protein
LSITPFILRGSKQVRPTEEVAKKTTTTMVFRDKEARSSQGSAAKPWAKAHVSYT